MINKFVSIKSIVSSLYRNLGINSEINEVDLIEWCSEALSMIGSYYQYEEISKCISLVNGKAKLPCGFDKLVDINYKGKPIYWSTNQNKSNYQCDNCNIPACNNGECEYTFYINNSYIITNINDEPSNLCLVYLGVPLDEDGYPLIPDDIYYNKALTSYVTLMLDNQEWRKGKLSDKVKNDSEINWLFYVNSAKGSANMPNKAQMENLSKIMMRLMPRPNLYKTGFRGLNKGEDLNI